MTPAQPTIEDVIRWAREELAEVERSGKAARSVDSAGDEYWEGRVDQLTRLLEDCLHVEVTPRTSPRNANQKKPTDEKQTG